MSRKTDENRAGGGDRAKAPQGRTAGPVRLEPFLAAEDRLVLMAVDPYWCFAYWSIHPRSLEVARSHARDPAARLVLRFSQIRRETEAPERVSLLGSHVLAHFDFAIEGARGKRYVDFWSPAKRLVAEIGLLAEDGTFAAVVRSNFLELPPEAESPIYEDRRARIRGETGRLWRPRAFPSFVEVMHAADAAIDWPEEDAEAQAAPEFAERAAAPPTAGGEPPRAGAAEPAGSGRAATGPAVAPGGRSPEVAPRARATPPPVIQESTGLQAAPALASQPDAPPSTVEPAAPVPTARVRESGEALPSDLAGVGISSFQAPSHAPRSRLEVHADLVIYGRAQPHTEVVIDGVVVPVREDGTFDVRFSLGGSGSPPAVPAAPRRQDDHPAPGVRGGER